MDHAFERRSVRLPKYNYAAHGAYFITICVHERACVLADPKTPDLRLTDLGWLVVERWMAIPERFPHVCNDAFVVMPNHIHGVLLLEGVSSSQTRTARDAFGMAQMGSIPTIVRSFKSAATKVARELTGRTDLTLWQRGYYDRVVRDEQELNDTRVYIKDNPRLWAHDELNA